MEEKINIAELLKDCPKGMELDCALSKVTLLSVDDRENVIFPIRVSREDGNTISLTKYGQYADADFAKCIIFPKGKTTWEGFVPPCEFKDGDIVSTKDGDWIGITTGGKTGKFIPTYCVLKFNGEFEAYLSEKEAWSFYKLATEEEKQKLFNAIKANGFKWNAETKTLEKLIEPIFKKGDKVRAKNDVSNLRIIDEVFDNFYSLQMFGKIYFIDQNNWELVSDKFDINSLIPFESRVLVRTSNDDVWRPAIYGFANSDKYYIVGGIYWKQCIPYDVNKELIGTTDNCDNYYKTWE